MLALLQIRKNVRIQVAGRRFSPTGRETHQSQNATPPHDVIRVSQAPSIAREIQGRSTTQINKNHRIASPVWALASRASRIVQEARQ